MKLLLKLILQKIKFAFTSFDRDLSMVDRNLVLESSNYFALEQEDFKIKVNGVPSEFHFYGIGLWAMPKNYWELLNYKLL